VRPCRPLSAVCAPPFLSAPIGFQMTVKLDRTDRTITELLQQDGRMSSAEIARRIGGVTERAVRYRIERLLRDDILRICAIVNPAALGYRVTGDILIEVESGHVQEVAERLVQHECVGYVACSMGERDISIQVNARSNEELYHFATEVLGKMEWVRKTVTFVVPLKLKDVDDWQIPTSACGDQR
jgi:Lrp/AsnC family transcriptional regulator for asnA, asnC and gidA